MIVNNSARVSGVVPAVVMPRVDIDLSEKPSALPLHPALATSSAFHLAALLAKLQRQPEVREELTQEATKKHTRGASFTQQAARRTAQSIIDQLPL